MERFDEGYLQDQKEYDILINRISSDTSFGNNTHICISDPDKL